VEDETDNWNAQKLRREAGQRYQAIDMTGQQLRGQLKAKLASRH
tara:strand:+ start:3255 stop:3386 length:132 start_codon:yes stop_codon:yes gene_type:complete